MYSEAYVKTLQKQLRESELYIKELVKVICGMKK